MPNSIGSGSSTLRGELVARIFFGCVCGPFAAGGLRGKKSTPSIGWEVLVRYSRLESKETGGSASTKYRRQFFASVTVILNCVDFIIFQLNVLDSIAYAF
jgi:hypothetical protein